MACPLFLEYRARPLVLMPINVGDDLTYWKVVTCNTVIPSLVQQQQQQQQQHSLFSQASWGRLEMKPERNKFKVQAH